MVGTVDVKTRPLRLAYLVDPDSREQVREAIRLSTTLWGGQYFPIVPLYKRMPRTWNDKPFKAPKAKTVILGLIDAFDPDVLVQLATSVPSFVTDLGLQVIKPENLWNDLSGQEENVFPRYGIGIFEILGAIYDEYFKYTRKYPIEVAVPQIPKKNDLFWASWFGEFPEKILGKLRSDYKDALEINQSEIKIENLVSFLDGKIIFPRRMTSFGINSYGRSSFRRNIYAFFLDASKVDDIVDYWNLRAVGMSVLPIPKQFQNEPGLLQLVANFLKDNRRPWKDQKVFDVVSIVKSHNSTIEEIEKFATNLKSHAGLENTSSNYYFVIQPWYPRIWDEWARDKDGVAPHDIYAEDEEHIEMRDPDSSNVRLKPLFPKFADRHHYRDSPRCANEISFRFYGSVEQVAGAFPKSSGREFNRAISGLTSFRHDWRVGRNGLVKLVRDDFPESRKIPLSEKVFFAWLEDLGWHAKLSAPGILAKRIHARLDGFVGVLRNENLLGLLERMNGGLVSKNGKPVTDNKISQERELSVGEVKSRLSADGHKNLHDYLVSKGVFRLGARVQCPHCTRSPWFSLEQIDDELVCPKCLNEFKAIGNLDSATWCYQASGPFSVHNYAEGAYSVLLTADFFCSHNSPIGEITPAYSFCATSLGKMDLEADFAAFWRHTILGERQDGVLFAECKTYGQFTKKDFDRMRYLGKAFPGAILVFSTLKKNLSASEISGLRRIAKQGRKSWKADRPLNPVIILTGTELLHYMGPPSCWDDETKKKFNHIGGLVGLADITQQIYLGLPSRSEEWQAKWEKRNEKRKRKTASA